MKKNWLIVFLMCGLTASSIGLCNNAVGIFYLPLASELNLLKGTVALHATIGLFSTAIMSLFMPSLMKKYKYKKMLIIAVMLAVLSTILMGYITNIYQLYILSCIRGLSTGVFAIVPVTSIISNYFEENVGKATSIALSFSGLAGAIFSPLLTSIIEARGLRFAYLIMGLLILVCTLPACIVPFEVNPKDKKKNTTISKNTIQLTFLMMCLVTVCHTMITGISQHLPTMSVSLGFSTTFGSLLISCSMIGNILSKLLIGILSDIFKPVKACFMMIICNLISLICIYIANITGNSILLMVGACLFGTIYSVGAVGIPLLVRYFFGQENYASNYAKIGFLTNLGSASSLTVIGYLYDFTNTYTIALIAAMCIHISNMILIFIISKKQVL